MNKLIELKNAIKCDILFRSEDGVDIYKGDSYCKVNNHSNYSMVTGFVAEGAHDNYKGLKFSTKEAAEEYILYNKPRFSLKDVFSVYPEFKKCEKERTKHAEELIHIARKK